MKTLNEKLDDLNSRKANVESRVNTELETGASTTNNDAQQQHKRTREASNDAIDVEENSKIPKYFSEAAVKENVDVSPTKNIGENFEAVSLPRNLETLEIDSSKIGATSLCELASLETAAILKSCRVSGLSNLRELIKWPEGLVPPSTFSCLEKLDIYRCNGLEKMLFVNVSLPNLTYLTIENCEKLKEIMFTTSEAVDVNLPKLQVFYLLCVPALESICNSNRPMRADSLRIVKIFGCPKVNRIPFLDNEGSSILKSLELIAVSEYWWHSLRWNHRDARGPLMPFCVFG